MSSTQQDNDYDANSSHPPQSDQGGVQPSVKLMDRMEKLAKWRIDPSWIEFPEDAVELHGGHATVSRALLKATGRRGGDTNESEGRRSVHQETIAVKKLKIADDKNVEQILGLALREAEFLAECSHSNIVELKGFVEHVSEGIIWLVFPWELNGNLRDFIASQDWEIPERISLIYGVAKGVEYLHSQKPPICHGDLKSVNILVDSDCGAIITDFGSARRIKEADPDGETKQVANDRRPATRLEATFSASTNTITLTGNEFTLRWAAPELLNDEQPTTKIDIWALGWISYEVMTNAMPFEDVVKDSIVIKRVTLGHLPSITGDARMSLMLQLCSLMSECWSTDPSQRPTATDCRKSLSWMPMIAPNSNRATATMVPEVRSPHLLLQLGRMHGNQADYATASKFYKEALGIFTDTGERRGIAQALENLAHMRRVQGKPEEAVALYSDALDISTSIGDKELKAGVLWGLAQAYKDQKKFSEAFPFYSEALKIFIDSDNSSGKADCLYGLASVHRARKEYDQAVTSYSDALQIQTDVRNRGMRAANLCGLAEVHRLQNENIKAIAFYSDALQIYIDIGNSRGRAFALLGVADSRSAQGHYDDAIDLFEQAAKIYEEIGHADAKEYALAAADDARQHRTLAEEVA